MNTYASTLVRARRLLVIQIGLALTILAQKNSDVAILEYRLLNRPFDTTVLGLVEQNRDPSLLPPLKRAFEEIADKRQRQAIAETLIRLGDKSANYFDYLAGFATLAVHSPAPTIWKYDSEGHMIKGAVSQEFESWCRDNGLDLRREMQSQMDIYPSDVLALARIRDLRATYILKDGLTSRNPMVVSIAARGLAWLQLVGAIPEIIAAAGRFPINDIGFQIAGALSEYEGELANRQIRASLGDLTLRGMYTKALARKQHLPTSDPK